jgi:hypothetical protein
VLKPPPLGLHQIEGRGFEAGVSMSRRGHASKNRQSSGVPICVESRDYATTRGWDTSRPRPPPILPFLATRCPRKVTRHRGTQQAPGGQTPLFWHTSGAIETPGSERKVLWPLEQPPGRDASVVKLHY